MRWAEQLASQHLLPQAAVTLNTLQPTSHDQSNALHHVRCLACARNQGGLRIIAINAEDQEAVRRMLRALVVGADAWVDDAARTSVHQAAEPLDKSKALPFSVVFADKVAPASKSPTQDVVTFASPRGAAMIAITHHAYMLH